MSTQHTREEILALWRQHRAEAMTHFFKGSAYNVVPYMGLPDRPWDGKEDVAAQTMDYLTFQHETKRVDGGKLWRVRCGDMVVEEGFTKERLP